MVEIVISWKIMGKSGSLKARKTFELLPKNGYNLGKSMLEAGYSKSVAKNPKQNLFVGETWKELAEKFLPDKVLLKKHSELLEQKQLNYFVFAKSLDDEEIKKHLEASGLKLVVIRPSEKGKLAFYSLSDPTAIKNGLELAYKIKRHLDPSEQSSNKTLVINISGASSDRYKLLPEGKKDAAN